MRILVDSDACPVKDLIWKMAQPRGIPVIWVVSTAHLTDFPESSQVVQVDSSPEAVDLALMNRVLPDDLVVTQDYGLAAMVLRKRAQAISPRGRIFLEEDMDQLLTERYIGACIRRAGGRTRGPSKLHKSDRDRFEKNFRQLLDFQGGNSPQTTETDVGNKG